jgi:peptidoglycan/xylan/chitin deacetylase (PgdA/CDA1 family)
MAPRRHRRPGLDGTLRRAASLLLGVALPLLPTCARPPERRDPPPAESARLRLPAQLTARTIRAPILMYHRLGTPRTDASTTTRGLTVEPAEFAQHMRWLHRNGFHAVRQGQLFAALVHGAPLPSRPVVITFDDGYRDVLEQAAPVLRRLGLPAVAYVITERASWGTSPFLTWPMLRRLERLGVEIGSHTVTHAALTERSDAAALAELRGSRRSLERHLGHPVQWLAYPYGAVDAHVAALARRAGYVLGVTTEGGAEQDARRPLELRRIRVLRGTGTGELAALLGVRGAR